ncbi:MAG: universal stress protein, partial [Pirellulales bacterium]|nr:universal stress protein [Pirellulales bacterium]
MGESESTDLDREVDQSMRLFERSQVGTAATISPLQPARVLWVLDGSSQDESAAGAAAYLHQRFQTETFVLDGRHSGHGPGEDLAIERSDSLAKSKPIARREGDSYDLILAAAGEYEVDFIILPCPFGRSFEQVGA